MSKLNHQLNLVISIVIIFVLTGCSGTKTSSIVNTNQLGKMMQGDSQVPKSTNYEMVELNSGVVVYRDKSVSRKSSSSDGSSVNPNFGSRDVSFNPDLSESK